MSALHQEGEPCPCYLKNFVLLVFWELLRCADQRYLFNTEVLVLHEIEMGTEDDGLNFETTWRKYKKKIRLTPEISLCS